MLIFDASTLILLAKSELLQTFFDSFAGEILIPKEVERECCGARKSLDALLIEKAINEKRITVKSLKERQLCRKIRADFGLGGGEAEAIALALSTKAQLVGIDDKNGINACKLLRLPFSTAINILIRMREKGLIEKEAALMKLAALERYGRYKSSIIADARSRLEGAE
jgi:predicted nucleic acid-binding protein